MNDKNDKIEELKIYKQFLELIFYVEMITEKYPRIEKNGLVATIKRTTYDGMKNIILAYRSYNKTEKLDALNRCDVDLKMLKVFIRVSHKRKFINGRNANAWSRKLYNIGNLLGGWINSCLKQ
jgi:hypothetical protein